MIDGHLEWEAECILAWRRKGGVVQFHVLWTGFHETECTWEPERNLRNSQELVRAFRAHFDVPSH